LPRYASAMTTESSYVPGNTRSNDDLLDCFIP
jgi:hypothetical protein